MICINTLTKMNLAKQDKHSLIFFVSKDCRLQNVNGHKIQTVKSSTKKASCFGQVFSAPFRVIIFSLWVSVKYQT